MTDLDWCKHALALAENIGWRDGVEHYRDRVLAAEYEAWATGELSEISDDAMCHGSESYRRSHPDLCAREALQRLDSGPPLGRVGHVASVGGER